MMPPEKVIEIKDLYFSYQDDHVLRNVSFEVDRGDYVGLMGQNGSGKSTLLKIILGLLKPQKGMVSLFGTPLKKFKEWEKIGYVPQRSGIFEQYMPATVEEIVSTGQINRRTIFRPMHAHDKEQIARALHIAELTHLRHRQLRELSGGQQQRVLIARALAGAPRLLVLDEPVVGVDVTVQHKFYDFLQKIKKELQMTLLLVSHDVDVVAHEADYLVCMSQGEVCRCTKEELTVHHKKLIAL